jgi:protein-tyrosine phosphatase
MMRRALIVCTANVCRSPVAERLLRRAISDRPDVDGRAWSIASAGTSPLRSRVDRHTIAAAAAVGLDLGGHQPRPLDANVLATDGADLVLVMARSHLRDVFALDPEAWSRTFTLRELVRRAATVAPPTTDEGFEGWLRRVAAGRRAADLLAPSALDDIADPYGRPRREHVAMVAELTRQIDALVERGPWTSSLSSGNRRPDDQFPDQAG